MITRLCDACLVPIPGPHCLELSVRVIRTTGDDQQGAVNQEEFHGEYCDGCVLSGLAMKDLLGDLTKYKPKAPRKA